MKKIMSCLLMVMLLLSVVACSSGNYEDELLGNWYTEIGDKSVLYVFEKEGDTYKGGRMGTSNGTLSSFETFDSFSASSSTITFWKGDSIITESYYFENGYLYIDDIKFEKVEE